MTYQYCLRCGNKFTRQTPRLFVCPKCDFHWYLNPKPCTVALLFNKNGELLMTRRKFPPKRGFWDLPGGFIEIKETIEESLQRELEEEIGTRVPNLKYMASYADRYLFKGDNYHVLSSLFFGTIHSTNITPGDDVAQIKFFSLKKLPTPKIAFRTIHDVLRDYQQLLKK